MDVTVETGMRGTASLVVSEVDTAAALRSGDIDVLGTPRLIALCEEAMEGCPVEAIGEDGDE